MTDESEIDNEANNIDLNGTIESYLQPPLKMVLETSSGSSIERQIHNVLRRHFLEQRSITWKPIKVELIVNTQLTDDFFAIRKKFERASDGIRTEFDEHYGFIIENETQINDICTNGYQCTETTFNVLGHSKGGVYVCKYADVCIRQASVRRTWEGNVTIKMMVFKIVQGKQTAALVRKGPKLQPIAPTPQFTSHCSVIIPKETDDLEKQFDQSQIFLYEFEGRETVKRPHHCLPYAIVSLIQDGSQWPANFDELDSESDILETDTLRVIAQTDDPLLQNKLKENVELAEAATLALEHIYEEDPPPALPVVEKEEEEQQQQQPALSQSTDAETIPATTSENTSVLAMNGADKSLSPTPLYENLPTVSPPPTITATDSTDSTSDPPEAPSTITTVTSSRTTTTPGATANASSPSPATIQAAYRQQTGLLGALPGAAAVRSMPGAVYATTAGLANGLHGQLVYGGVSLDALRGLSGAAPGSASSPYMLSTHAGQTVQQPALYAAQLQAIAQQQQIAQFAAAAAAQQQQQQQQQQQSFLNGIPAGCMLVRTANGGYALLAQSPSASAGALQAQASLGQQQYISINAAGQPTTVGAARLPVAFMGGQPQQVVYQYGGQPTMQTASPQFIQMPSNYAQQQLSTSPVMQGSPAYSGQTPTQYIGAPQPANNATQNHSSNSTSSGLPQGAIVTPSATMQSPPTSSMISPQKQSAASATAAALQQQQQYRHASYSAEQQQQQQQQLQSANGAHGTGAYYAAIAQAQAQLTAQVQAQQQQQQHLNLLPQMQYGTQQGVSQPMYYTTPGGQTIYQVGGQSYLLTQPGTTTTGAPAIYSAGPTLHNGASQQPSQSQSVQSQQQQQQMAYQLAAANGQSTNAAYQMLAAASGINVPSQQQAPNGVVAQQAAQLVQRPGVLSQVRHHPYRN